MDAANAQMDKPRTQRIYTDHIRQRPYHEDICPWTGADCPPGPAPSDEGPRRPRMRCSIHNIELSGTGECEECEKLIPPKKPRPRPKPWWQFW